MFNLMIKMNKLLTPINCGYKMIQWVFTVQKLNFIPIVVSYDLLNHFWPSSFLGQN